MEMSSVLHRMQYSGWFQNPPYHKPLIPGVSTLFIPRNTSYNMTFLPVSHRVPFTIADCCSIVQTPVFIGLDRGPWQVVHKLLLIHILWQDLASLGYWFWLCGWPSSSSSSSSIIIIDHHWSLSLYNHHHSSSSPSSAMPLLSSSVPKLSRSRSVYIDLIWYDIIPRTSGLLLLKSRSPTERS